MVACADDERLADATSHPRNVHPLRLPAALSPAFVADLPRDRLDPAKRPVFLPGIKHGIRHRLTSNDQPMSGCIAGDSRDSWVPRADYRATSAACYLMMHWPR
jgi:hypothetical protein